VVIDAGSDILVCCETIFEIFDSSLVTFCDDLQLANIVQQSLYVNALQKDICQ